MGDLPFIKPDVSLIPEAILTDEIRGLLAGPLASPYQQFGGERFYLTDDYLVLCRAHKNYFALDYALARLGAAHFRVGDLDTAERVHKTTVMMGSWHPQVFDELFSVYVEQNNLNGAFWLLSVAQERINSTGPDYHYAKAKFFKLLVRATTYEWDAKGVAHKIRRKRAKSSEVAAAKE